MAVSWENLSAPGAYVELGTGDLYRVPKEALIQGGSPVIRKESLGASRLAQLSKTTRTSPPSRPACWRASTTSSLTSSWF